MFSSAVENNIISGIELRTGKQTTFSTNFQFSRIVDWATTYCFPLHYISLGYSPDCLPRQQILRNTSKLSY